MSADEKNDAILQTENASLREALKQVLYQNEMLLGWVRGAVVTVDKEGLVTSANDIALSSLGWDFESLNGRHFHELCHHTLDDGSEYPWEFCPLFAAIEDGSSHHVTGDLFWKSDGKSFVVDYIACPVRNENNLISGATLIFRNLTEQRLQEAKRIHGMKLESLGELSAGIAHEINTPIQFIGSNLAFLREAFEDLLGVIEKYQEFAQAVSGNEEFKELLLSVEDKLEEADIEYLFEEAPKAFEQTGYGVKRVTELVLGLKGFAHSAENENKTEADINEIINNTLIVCRNTYKYNAELETDLGELPDVKVYHGDIGQVILNLIVNAAQAIEDVKSKTGEMGRITVTSRHDGNAVVITVGDSGGGIPESVRERIFDPFFTTKEVGRGSGQGLAIARTIVEEKHGGEISFETVAGQGSVFTVRLPVNG